MAHLNVSILCALALSLTSPTSTVRAEATAASLTFLKQWAGKHPSDALGGHDFWSAPKLRAAVTAVIGRGEFQNLINFTRNGPSGPVEVWGDYVFADVCKAGNCHDQRFNLVINTALEKVWVCRSNLNSSARGVVLWSGPDRRDVPSRGDCTIADEDGPHDDAYFKRFLKIIPAELAE